MKTKSLFVLFGTLLLATTVAHAQKQAAPKQVAPQRSAGTAGERATFQPRAGAPKYAKDRLIVRFRPGTPKFRSEAAHAAVSARTTRSFKAVREMEVVRLAEGMRVEEALRAYRKDPAVLYAEPDYVVHALQNPVTPNDPRFAELWGLQKIQAPQAWGITAGSPQVVVAVIDTGIDYTHQDLAANVFRNPVDCNGNGVDDEGNGFVDDCYGIDAANGDSDPMDDNRHGTHVAGTIGAAGNNGIGVVGVNWTVQLMACKFLDDSGSGYTSDAVTCLDYVATMKERGVNIVATNNSWGGGDFSQALFDAIDLHRQRGILFIAAAGNDGSNNDASPSYPDGYFLPNVISVGATERTADDRSADFSNFGRRSVHLGAPGVDILSTTPGNTYDSFSGTSMAAPHVSGVAALLAAQDSTRDWKAIKNLILAGGDTRAVDFDPARFLVFLNKTITRKRLNAYGAMTCTNSAVLARLQPRTNLITASHGLEEPVDIAVLHINCAAPNGEVTVLVDGGPQTITLLDDGQGTDQEAGDGIYSGQWVPPGIGAHSFTIPNAELQLVDLDDNTTTVVDDVFTVQVLSPYTFSTNVGFNYRSIVGNFIDFSPYWDDGSALINSSFPIPFGGGSITRLFVNTNGNITFNQASYGFFNQPIPAPPNFVPSRVAPFWDDLQPVALGGVFWEVIGSPPNRELVVEWRGINFFDCTSDFDSQVTFQAVFFESSSDILFNYADVNTGPDCPGPNLGASATVGVQVSSQVGTQFSFNTPALADNMAILWTLGAPNPSISRLAPFAAVVGDPGLTLQVFGMNFVPLSQVHWNGSPRSTTFVNSNQLAASISAADIAAAANVQVSVVSPSPGGTSNLLPFTIYASYPVPSLTSLDPSQVIASGCTTCTDSSFPLTVTGADFVSSSVVRWNGADRPTTVLSSTQAQAEIPYSDVADGGNVEITIFNPAPGGGVSNVLSLAVENPVPLIDVVYPAAVAPGAGFTLTVLSGYRDCADPGNDPCYSTFVPSSVVRWNGADRSTLFLHGGQLEATIPASDVASPGTAEITVFTPAPGGGTSNVVLFDIVPRPPNDNLADAMVISTFPFTHTVDTRTATTETTEPRQTCINLVDQSGNPVDFVAPNSVWYKFTPTTDMTINANTLGSNFATVLSVWRNTPVYPAGVVTCSNGWTADGPGTPSVDFTAAAGTTYYFFITSYPSSGAAGGTLVFNVSGSGPETNRLNINFAGSGSGTVTSNPAGVNCGGTCAVNFTSGTTVTLTANPASGSVFSGWGGACTGSGPCSLTMDAARAVTATFNLQQEFGFGAPPPGRTVTAGQPAQYTIEISGQPGFAGAVSFACTSGVPQGAACSFNPASVSPGGGTATTTLTVTTTSGAIAMSRQTSIAVYACWLLPLGLLLASRSSCSRQRSMFVLLVVMLLLVGSFAACGSGSEATSRPPGRTNPLGTPAGNYTITVTATSGGTSQTQTVTLTVN